MKTTKRCCTRQCRQAGDTRQVIQDLCITCRGAGVFKIVSADLIVKEEDKKKGMKSLSLEHAAPTAGGVI